MNGPLQSVWLFEAISRSVASFIMEKRKQMWIFEEGENKNISGNLGFACAFPGNTQTPKTIVQFFLQIASDNSVFESNNDQGNNVHYD